MKTFVCLNCKSIFEDLSSKKRLYCKPACVYESKYRRQKLRIASTGKHHSEDTKQKMCDSKKRELHPLFRKHRSKKTKNKMKVTRRRNILVHNASSLINPVPVHIEEEKGGIRHTSCSHYNECLDIVVKMSMYMEEDLKVKNMWRYGFSCIECNRR